MKTLVTGGTGFIGGHLVKALVSKGRDVRCLVRSNSDIKHLSELKVEFFKGDLLNRDSLEKAVRDVDIVYHLAAVIKPIKVRKGDDAYQSVNVGGTENLIKACLGAKIQKFIYFSSIAACGPAKTGTPLNESSFCGPVSLYGKSKDAAEKIVFKFHRHCNFPMVIIRPSNVYGPGTIDGYMPALIKYINKGLFFMIGDGEGLMSFCYIDNLIKGSILAEEKKVSTGHVYFISDERPYKINEIAETIANEEKVKLPNIHIPLWLADKAGCSFELMGKIFDSTPAFSRETIKGFTANYWICDSSKAKRELEYAPNIGLSEGIKRTVEWFRKKGYIN